MTTDDIREDPVMEAFARLPVIEPDPRRAERVRARCHGAMGQRQWAEKLPARATSPFSWRRLEPALLAGVCAVYLFEVLRRALLLYGF
jgi:hypothetical protein